MNQILESIELLRQATEAQNQRTVLYHFEHVEKLEVNGAAAEVKQASAPSATEAEKPSADRLTISQWLMLMETVLDITFDALYTNQSALAVFVSRLSGYSVESVRQKILSGIDYDKRGAVKDGKKIAVLLEPLRPDLAEKVRNNILE